jgi:hypothetical protein
MGVLHSEVMAVLRSDISDALLDGCKQVQSSLCNREVVVKPDRGLFVHAQATEGITMSTNVREEGLLTRLAVKHDVSREGVKTVLNALRRGSGMAQFSHSDFGGMAQWSPGMTMVGDMFNTSMKAKLDAVATELAAYLKDTPEASSGKQGVREAASGSESRRSHDQWWPSELGNPSTSGAQNAMRYAVFPDKQRLLIDDHGTVSVYDTGDHRISGVSQAQSTSAILTFTSQNGTVDLSQLKKARPPVS